MRAYLTACVLLWKKAAKRMKSSKCEPTATGFRVSQPPDGCRSTNTIHLSFCRRRRKPTRNAAGIDKKIVHTLNVNRSGAGGSRLNRYERKGQRQSFRTQIHPVAGKPGQSLRTRGGFPGYLRRGRRRSV